MYLLFESFKMPAFQLRNLRIFFVLMGPDPPLFDGNIVIL